jgi:hypothetical protein
MQGRKSPRVAVLARRRKREETRKVSILLGELLGKGAAQILQGEVMKS